MNKYLTILLKTLKLNRPPYLCNFSNILIAPQNYNSILKIASVANSKNDSAPEIFDFNPLNASVTLLLGSVAFQLTGFYMGQHWHLMG